MVEKHDASAAVERLTEALDILDGENDENDQTRYVLLKDGSVCCLLADIRTVLGLLAESERVLGCASVALNIAVKWADRLHERWDNDEDSKVGKGLLALSGHLPGYAPDTDGIHAFIREVNEYRSTRAAAEAARKERGAC